MSLLVTRLTEAGWTVKCQRFVDIETSADVDGSVERTCTWRAIKGIDELVVKARLNDQQTALRYLYDLAKSVDPDLQQIAMESGSGGWVFDLTDAESELNRKKP